MSGRRLSRALPPVVGQRVMSRDGSVPMFVARVDTVDLRALCDYRKSLYDGARSRWFDYSALYDATDLLSWNEMDARYNGLWTPVFEYVVPGSVAFQVQRLYREGGRCCAALSNGTNIWVKADAPRFRRVV